MLTDDQLADRIGPRLRSELAAIEPPADLLDVLHRRQTHQARAARAAKITAVPLAAAATALAVALTSLTAPAPSTPAMTVRVLAYRAAAAAAAQSYLPPGQWLHWTERVASGTPSAPLERTIQQWTTADARKGVLFGLNGVPEVVPCRYLLACPMDHENYFNQITKQALGFGWAWKLPLSYADLGSLPRSPAALDAYLAGLHQAGGWSEPVTRPNSNGSLVWMTWPNRPPAAPFREFELIEELLATYVMPPRLTAELYRAIADIPGVAVNPHAVDVAGRSGISFTMKVPATAGGGSNEIVFNPHTYRLMGQQAIGYWNWHHRNPVLNGTAILSETPVSGPAAQP